MKVILHYGGKPPTEHANVERIRIGIGDSIYEIRERDGMLLRIEEHDDALAMDLAVFPMAGNMVRLKGGLR